MRERLWERLDEYLFEKELFDSDFSSAELANDLGMTRPEASQMIQAYLREQRSPNSRTLYSIHRVGRTTGARWMVARRVFGSNSISATLAEDIRARFERAYAPDMRRLGSINRAQAEKIEANLKTAFDGIEAMFAVAVRDIVADEEQAA